VGQGGDSSSTFGPMKWQGITISLCALLASIFLVDSVFALRFTFPAGSLGRSFFFNIGVELAVFISPLIASYAYYSGFKRWRTPQKTVYGVLLVIPWMWQAYVWGFGLVFVLTDRP